MGDSAAVSCLVSVLEFRMETDAAAMIPMASELVAACDYIVRHYDKFDLIPEIYGDLRSKLTSMRESLIRMPR